MVGLFEVQKELCGIKSIQQQFVKHSKLSRKKLKLEKEIGDIKAGQIPKITKAKNVLNYLKVGDVNSVAMPLRNHAKS